MTTTARLDALIAEMTLDADDEEQISGFLVGADEALKSPRRSSGSTSR